MEGHSLICLMLQKIAASQYCSYQYQLIRNVGDGTYHFAHGTRRVKIIVTGGSKLYIPRVSEELMLKWMAAHE